MRILFCGDIVGRSGRECVLRYLPTLKSRLALDVVVANGENAAHGFGLTQKICEELLGNGVDVITTGNHVWDQKEIIPYISRQPRLIRPLNYPPGSPGQGSVLYKLVDGRTLFVINAMGRLFMDMLDDPFRAIEDLLKKTPLKTGATAILIDFHGEASSEKQILGYLTDGRVSGVVGTHTHVPTADARILPKGTAFQTDVGMCGDYDSIIGMDPFIASQKMLKRMPTELRLQPTQGPGTLCGTFIETDDATGLAKRVAPVRIGPVLEEAIPVL